MSEKVVPEPDYKGIADRIEQAKDAAVVAEIVKSLTKAELVALMQKYAMRQREVNAYTISALDALSEVRQRAESAEQTVATKDELIIQLRDDLSFARAEISRQNARAASETVKRAEAEAEARQWRKKAGEKTNELFEANQEIARLDKLSEKRAVRRITRGIGTAWNKLDDRTQKP